jgi:hypothetical protein
MGLLPAQGVSRELGQARFGFCDYGHPDFLAKSGAFQALAAHGLACFVSGEEFAANDGLIPGSHFMTVGKPWAKGPASIELLEEAGKNLFTWYQGHTLANHAREVAASVSLPVLG